MWNITSRTSYRAWSSEEPLHLPDESALETTETNVGLTIPRQLRIPPNLFITGTVNVDETTHMFSPKVLDRAFTIEFNEVDLKNYPVGASNPVSSLSLDRFPGHLVLVDRPSSADWGQLTKPPGGELRQVVMDLHQILAKDNRHFGYRVANEIAAFLLLAEKQTSGNDEAMRAALDLAVVQKVLPKLHGTQQELQELLIQLFTFAVSGKVPKKGISETWDQWELNGGPTSDLSLPRTATKLGRMLRRLKEQGFTSFME